MQARTPGVRGGRTRRCTRRARRPGPAPGTASGPTRRLLEDAAEGVQLLGHPACLADDLRERHDLYLAVPADWNHSAPAGRDQLGSANAQSPAPDAVRRRGRAPALEVAEDGHASLESSLTLHQPRQRIADAALGQPYVAERIRVGRTTRLVLELGDVCTFSDHDDAEQLAFPAAPVEVADDILECQRELRNDDHVGAACQPAGERHPA